MVSFFFTEPHDFAIKINQLAVKFTPYSLFISEEAGPFYFVQQIRVYLSLAR